VAALRAHPAAAAGATCVGPEEAAAALALSRSAAAAPLSLELLWHGSSSSGVDQPSRCGSGLPRCGSGLPCADGAPPTWIDLPGVDPAFPGADPTRIDLRRGSSEDRPPTAQIPAPACGMMGWERAHW
jgi:hypothetical protein